MGWIEGYESADGYSIVMSYEIEQVWRGAFSRRCEGVLVKAMFPRPRESPNPTTKMLLQCSRPEEYYP